ncbi:MAG: carboxypeptidase-like regulatory domain-containing protein [Planctomycetota bacterium]
MTRILCMGLVISTLCPHIFLRMVSAQERSAQELSDPPPSNLRQLLVELCDEQGQPIEGAKVLRNLRTEEAGFDRSSEYATDSDGRVALELPHSVRFLRLWIIKDGFPPLFASWDESESDAIPEHLKLVIPHGKTAGGVVVDSSGKPIANAKIEVRLQTNTSPASAIPNLRYYTTLASGENAVVTDAQGRWMLNEVPPVEDTRLSLKIAHEQFIQDQYWNELRNTNGVTTEQLMAKTARIVMRRGVAFSGRIVNRVGVPVANAALFMSKEENLLGGTETKCDENGVFRLPPQTPGEYFLAVTADKHRPTFRKTTLQAGGEELEITLPAGNQLPIRVVDLHGSPIADASIKVERWKKMESLVNGGQCVLFDGCGIANTNNEGRTVWRSAPDEMVRLLVRKNGFCSTRIEVLPSESEQLIRLHPILQVTGRIMDAESGETIAARMVPVSNYISRPDDPIVQRSQIRPTDGTFDYRKSLWDDGINLVLQFEAPGYRPCRIGPFNQADGTVKHDVRLHRAPSFHGQIVDPSNQPVQGANVSFATKDTSLIVHDWTYRRGGSSTRTDEHGEFAFDPTLNPPVIIATHETGYAETSLGLDEQPGVIRLQPWARVEGTLVRDGRPVTGPQLFPETCTRHSAPRADTASRI